MNLVIVESPAKSKTIEKYLGSNFKVLASFGHVRDLPQKDLGIDIENNYEPRYVTPPKSKKTISQLNEQAKNADIVYLATDLDREGEAISWHVLNSLKLNKDTKVLRIVFSEITESALKSAIKNPRDLDMNLVDAQQARRVLDRLVGYKLSPFLWKKVRAGLSAGRVQSVAVRLVVEREREITGFDPKEYWVLGANLAKKENIEKIFASYLIKIGDKDVKKYDIENNESASEIASDLKGAEYKVADILEREKASKPSAPFTTSTLQMEASRKLGFSPKQTMRLAQALYEAGQITYMRTDSVNLSSKAVAEITKLIEKDYGKNYLTNRLYKTKAKKAQEAHEAIRPTNFFINNVSSDSREQKLYNLIWKRSVASQMSDAIFKVVEVTVEAKSERKYVLKSVGEQLKFDGFIKVYKESIEDDDSETMIALPDLKIAEALKFISLINEQKFTEPPKRYSEAMLIKKLESLGIGRPSTYAPTIDTIIQRGYVVLENKKFKPEEIGFIVTDLLVKHFSTIVDYGFTAKMEDDLDSIADGDKEWRGVVDSFYQPFSKLLVEKTTEVSKEDVMPTETLDEKCPDCGQALTLKLGRFGRFIACSGFPKCRYSRPLEKKTEDTEKLVVADGDKVKKLHEAITTETCPKCGAKMVLKEGRFGQFLACENYPNCKSTKAIMKKTDKACPKCHKGQIVERRTKRGKIFWGCSLYPECDYATWDNPDKKEESKE